MPLQKPKKVQFGEQGNADMWRYVEDNCDFWLRRTRNFRENTLLRYAELYKGVPAQSTKNSPWPNAANNVIQLIATQCDELLSRVMSIYMIDPLWPVKLFGDIDEVNGISGHDQKQTFETFLADMAMSTDELDMYRTEQTWWSSTIRNGTGVVNLPYQYTVEKQLVDMPGLTDGTTAATKPLFSEFIKYDGPRPENIPLNKFVNNLNYSKLDDSPFKFEIQTLSRYQVQERAELGLWDAKDVERILSQPDRAGRAQLQQYIEETQGVELGDLSAPGDEYDILQVWFTYWKDGEKFSCVAFLHRLSRDLETCGVFIIITRKTSVLTRTRS